MNETTVCFIGSGNMATSMIGGLIQQDYQSIHVSSPSAAEKPLLQKPSIQCFTDNQQAAKQQEVIILAVKPHQILAVCEQLAPLLAQQTSLIVSVAAGITIEQIASHLPAQQAIVRAMPNTAATVGLSASVLSANAHTTHTQQLIASDLLSAIGETSWLQDESLMNAVTALSGSGPAYFFYMMEALVSGACELGLPQALAEKLVQETALGAATLAKASNESLSTLRQAVTSPGGTTQAALQSLEKNQITAHFKQAIIQATARAKILEQQASTHLSTKGHTHDSTD